jgi:hypothetical protein
MIPTLVHAEKRASEVAVTLMSDDLQAIPAAKRVSHLQTSTHLTGPYECFF